LDAGERSRAAALAQEELASHPADADAWRLLASVSDGALARAAWEAALALEPDHSPSRRALVVHLLAAGQGAAALATAESLDDPLLSARCAWAAGDHEQTRRFLAKAPAHPDRERLALLLAVESDDRAAARTAAEALLRLPDLVDRTAVLMQLAGVSEGITAENALRQAHAADPMRGVLPLARWLIAAERSAEARRLLDDHLASRPGDGYAWRLRHWLAD
jgi:predicted Zn-dependent protease